MGIYSSTRRHLGIYLLCSVFHFLWQRKLSHSLFQTFLPLPFPIHSASASSQVVGPEHMLCLLASEHFLCSNWKTCPRSLWYSSLQRVKRHSLPLECGLHQQLASNKLNALQTGAVWLPRGGHKRHCRFLLALSFFSHLLGGKQLLCHEDTQANPRRGTGKENQRFLPTAMWHS